TLGPYFPNEKQNVSENQTETQNFEFSCSLVDFGRAEVICELLLPLYEGDIADGPSSAPPAPFLPAVTGDHEVGQEQRLFCGAQFHLPNRYYSLAMRAPSVPC
ncbi:hypothetical protein ATANTOWER_019713, partial [Ataeniobius toweri]|nr:hypothetical protein [Ataeniobius toweri]